MVRAAAGRSDLQQKRADAPRTPGGRATLKPMRSRKEVDEVLELGRRALSQLEIARRTGIPRATVRDWLAGRTPRPPRSSATPQPTPPDRYSQLLGLYLGDGHVVALRRTYMLRIFFDARYPGLIGDAVRSVRSVAPRQRVSVFRRLPTNCVVVRCYWNDWPTLFPQHGPGRKHQRTIALADWQRRITYAWPREFVRGLINSDGSRFLNPVRHGDRRYEYVRYDFSNRSAEIRGLLCEHLDLLGIAWRPLGRWHVSIARREAVAALDAFVGPKT
jgi:hypothetical protein